MVNTDEKYMKEAIKQAKKAYAIGEVPIGCVIVYQDKIIGRGYNRRTIDNNTLAHAELIAIKKASKKMNDWRLEDCTMYVTLEPCQMCAGAIVQARVSEVVIGCMNPKAGCAGSILNLLEMAQFNHQVKVTRNVLQEECSEMLKDFFRQLRSDIRLHGHDLSVFHGDITVIHIRGSHHCSIFDDQIILFHSKTSFTAFSLFRVLCLFVFCFQYYIMFLSALFKNQLARRDTVHDRTDI